MVPVCKGENDGELLESLHITTGESSFSKHSLKTQLFLSSLDKSLLALVVTLLRGSGGFI